MQNNEALCIVYALTEELTTEHKSMTTKTGLTDEEHDTLADCICKLKFDATTHNGELGCCCPSCVVVEESCCSRQVLCKHGRGSGLQDYVKDGGAFNRL